LHFRVQGGDRRSAKRNLDPVLATEPEIPLSLSRKTLAARHRRHE
jgi:hypothetical protein